MVQKLFARMDKHGKAVPIKGSARCLNKRVLKTSDTHPAPMFFQLDLMCTQAVVLSILYESISILLRR